MPIPIIVYFSMGLVNNLIPLINKFIEKLFIKMDKQCLKQSVLILKLKWRPNDLTVPIAIENMPSRVY